MIPFSPPRIDQKIIDEVVDTLRSGWITTGPKTRMFEKKLEEFCGNPRTLCVSSGTDGMELLLKWYGVGQGDEVIVPAYTYSATANVVHHTGATPVMVDTNKEDFNLSVEEVSKAITSRTKVIIPVDVGGMPCEHDKLKKLVEDPGNKSKFHPDNELQEKLGRILILADSAHSLGAYYKGKPIGMFADVSVFSFHAVKNLTTGEGGAVALNLPTPFSNDKIYDQLNILSLHGQTKDALSKLKENGWKYDVLTPGYKANMTDILASIGLVEIDRYKEETLKKRREIICYYSDRLKDYSWAITPVFEKNDTCSSYHLFMLRIKDIGEKERDEIIKKMFNKGVSVNVHFQPLPVLSCYKKMGYPIADFPNAYENYKNEISLPVYYDLTDTDRETVIDKLIETIKELGI